MIRSPPTKKKNNEPPSIMQMLKKPKYRTKKPLGFTVNFQTDRLMRSVKLRNCVTPSANLRCSTRLEKDSKMIYSKNLNRSEVMKGDVYSLRRKRKPKVKDRSNSKNDKFNFQKNVSGSNNFKDLYQANMNFLIRSARNSSVYKKVEQAKKTIMKMEISKNSIPHDKYYITKLLESLLMKKKLKLNKRFIEHFSLCCQSFLYVQKLELPDISELEGKFVTLPEPKKNRSKHYLSYKCRRES